MNVLVLYCEYNRWMLSFSSILNKTDKSSIEALNYCKIDVKIFLKNLLKIQAFTDPRIHSIINWTFVSFTLLCCLFWSLSSTSHIKNVLTLSCITLIKLDFPSLELPVIAMFTLMSPSFQFHLRKFLNTNLWKTLLIHTFFYIAQTLKSKRKNNVKIKVLYLPVHTKTIKLHITTSL